MKTNLTITTLAGTMLMAALSLPATAEHGGHAHGTNPGTKSEAAQAVTAVPGGATIVATINGLVCDYCAQSIHKTLLREPGVAEATVDLSAKTVTVALKPGSSLAEARLKELLTDAGYDLTGYRVE